MREKPELYVECATAEEVGQALARGYAVATSQRVASQCGAPPPGDADLEDDLEDVLEAHLHPYGDLEPPEGEEGAL